MYTQASADYITNLWWQARKIDSEAADYLAHEVDQRVSAGRSMDCDALIGLEAMAKRASAFDL